VFRPAHRLSPALLLGGLTLISTGTGARANSPGGGTGFGPDVTLQSDGEHAVILANGLVTARIDTETGQILRLTYHGVQVTDGGTRGTSAFYWQGGDQIGGEQVGSNGTYTVVQSPASTGGDGAEISVLDRYTNQPMTADCADADFHFILFRGSPGIYVAEVMSRPARYPAGQGSPFSFTCKLASDLFDWLSEDTGRNLGMPSLADWEAGEPGINDAPKEVRRLTTGRFAGQFECKYNYSGQLGSLNVTGWSSTARRLGIWCISPSHEYFSGGPMHRELLSQIMLINNPFFGGHFGFHPDLSFAANETWSKVYGPFFIYFNHVAPEIPEPQAALYADAQAQAAAEQQAWPYAWFNNPAYAPASARGSVTGRIAINDPGNPRAAPAGLWVGLAQTPPSQAANTDFQFFAKNYQFWVKTGSDGRFSIPNVIAGANYTLFAFGPGAIGLFQSQMLPGPPPPVALEVPAKPFPVKVVAGSEISLGNIVWTPPRTGPTVFEIGVPDRDAAEFRHGDDYWHGDFGTAAHPAGNWAPFQDYAADFPGGLVYTVGQSRWAHDWNYAQPTVRDPGTGELVGTTQKIIFHLGQAPAPDAQASLYFAFAADFQGPIVVTVNNLNVTKPANGFDPAYATNHHACDAMVRMSSQGVFCDYRLNFPANTLHAGTNEIDLGMRRGGYFSNSVLYDYLRLELTGYVPPAPAGLTASRVNNVIQLAWQPVPGATGYNILRAPSGTGNFQLIAHDVPGPVAGSSPEPTAYTDATASGSGTYDYCVQSVNPVGVSPSSAAVRAVKTASIAVMP
jgi:rhamnogalacturonan endolyase